MNESYGEERRLNPVVCEKHAECSGRVEILAGHYEELKEGQKCMLKKMAWMTRLVYTGMGLFMAGGLLVGVLFSNMETVKADVGQEVQEHQAHIEKEQDKVGLKMDTLTVAVTTLERQVAVLGIQVAALSDTIGELKDELKERQ